MGRSCRNTSTGITGCVLRYAWLYFSDVYWPFSLPIHTPPTSGRTRPACDLTMNSKLLHKQSGRMHWIILVVAIVVVILVALTASVIIRESGQPTETVEQSVADAYRAALASEHAPSVGDPNAPVHIVEFIDPACETCALFFPMVKAWMNQVPGQIRLSVRHVPFHSGSEHAVRILEASRLQGKYWETLEALLASQQTWTRNHTVIPERLPEAVANVGLDMAQLDADLNAMQVLTNMERDQEDAIFLKVRATPQYYVNERPLEVFGAEQLAQLVREEIEKANN